MSKYDAFDRYMSRFKFMSESLNISPRRIEKYDDTTCAVPFYGNKPSFPNPEPNPANAFG